MIRTAILLLALAGSASAEATKLDVKIIYEVTVCDGYDVALTANGERFNFHFVKRPANTLTAITEMAKSRIDAAALAATPEAIKIVKLAEAAEAGRVATEAAAKIKEIQVLYPTEKLPTVVVTPVAAAVAAEPLEEEELP